MAKVEKSKTKKSGSRGRGVLDLPKAVEDRLAEGRAERETVPLEAHGEWTTPGDRPDAVGVLEEQNRARVPELVPIRHGRMIVSPFTFYRGGAAIMAWDLSRTPSTGLRVQCCGDAHLSNFGVFAAPDRRLVFDLNDFDETLPAPFEWDVKRLVASIVVAARGNGHRPKEQRAAARATVAAYRRDDGRGFSDAVPRRLVHAGRRRRAVREPHRQRGRGHDQVGPEIPVQGPVAHQPRLAVQARHEGRWRLPDQAAAADHRAPARAPARRCRAAGSSGADRLRRHTDARPPCRA